MALILGDDSNNISKEKQKEVRNLVLSGLEQIKQGKTKRFEELCDRLEKKYSLWSRIQDFTYKFFAQNRLRIDFFYDRLFIGN